MEPSATLDLAEQAMDLAFHREKELLAVGLVNGRLQVFDCAEATPAQTLVLDAHKLSCRAVAFATRASLLLSGSADLSVLVFDLAKEKTLGRLTGAHAAEITRLCAVDANVFASGDEAGVIKTWDLRQRKEAHHFAHHTDYISDLAAHAQHHCILATSADGTLSATDLRKQKLRGQSGGDPDDGLESLALLKGGRKVVCGSMSGVVSIFDWGKFDDPSGQFPGHPSSVDAMVRLDEDSVVTGSGDGVLRALSVLPNKFLGVLGEDPEGGCDRLSISADSRLLASTSYGTVVRLWDMDEDEQEEQQEEAGEAGPEGQAEKEAGSSSSDDEEVERRQKRRPKKKRKKESRADSRADFFKDLL